MEEEADHHRDQQEEEVIVGCKEQQNATTITTTTSNNVNNNIIIKGKRTKRLRPQSPIPFAIPTNSSTAEGGGGGGGGEYCNNNTTNSSPTTSEEYQDSTEEEEDMANCLILLAQGHSRGPSSSPKLHQPHNDHQNTATTSSRRFLDATPLAAAVGTTKVAVAGTAAAGGYYVYECKTCNRTFPSFQALGGHRASHKKPKAAINVDHDKKQFGIGVLPSDEEDTQLFKNMNINNNTSSSSPLSLHLSNRGLVLSSNNNNKSKVHECSICGAEFNSGQALGGHMRRHRAPVGGPAANTTLALTAAPPPTVPLALEAPRTQQNQHQLYNQQQQPLKKQRSMLSLDLDLNLPAPEDDHHHRDQSKFVFTPKQQQQQQQPQQPQQQQQQERLRILVDCHY